MTRNILALAWCIVLVGAQVATAQKLDFKHTRLQGPSSNGDGQLASLLYDIDKDGIDDMVVTERIKTPSVVWYKRSGSSWKKYVIDNEQWRMDSGGDYHDIDGDGDDDFVVGCGPSCNSVYWYENPYPNYNPNKPWPRHVVKNSGADEHHDQVFGDFDDDGDAEFVTWNQSARQLLLAEIPANPKGGAWKFDVIYRSSDDEYEGLAVADIDQDGKDDIVGAGRWFKHQGGTQYKEQVIDKKMKFSRVRVGQLIRGGRQEVVFSDAERKGVLRYYEWTGGGWKGTTLATVNAGHSLDLGDVNGDGNLDVFSGEKAIFPYRGSKTRVFLGNGKGNFEEVMIAQGREAHESRLGDLDGDGDLDIMGKPFTYNVPGLDIYLNETKGGGGYQPPKPPSNEAPQVTIVSPKDQDAFAKNKTIVIKAEASDADGEVVEVAFYADGKLLGRDNKAPFAFTWPEAEPGTYTLKAQATDDDGAKATSGAVDVAVEQGGGNNGGNGGNNGGNGGNNGGNGGNNGGNGGGSSQENEPPVVLITNPSDGASLPDGVSGTVTVKATDPDGTVDKVTLTVNSTQLGVDTSAPFNFTFNNIPVGEYLLVAEAVDNDGAVSKTTASVGIGTTVPGVSTNDLVAYWAFDEGNGKQVTDGAGKGHNGQVLGNPGWVNGKAGSALNLDGKNDYVVAEHAPAFEVNDAVTIMGWFKNNLGAGDHAAGIEKADAYRILVKQPEKSGDSHWMFDFWGEDGSFNRVSTMEPVSNGAWHHIAATYNGSQMKIYVDGELAGSKEASGLIHGIEEDLEIGRRDRSAYFGGVIDEVRIYAKALSPNQIQQIASGAAVATAGPSAEQQGAMLKEETDLPGGYRLGTAYPNPFNPQTQFTLEVSQAQQVRVEVYDLLGRRVALLHDGTLSAGQAHAFTFEASRLPSGTYVLRASGETFQQTQTLVLLK